ncbi:dTDP-4-dehydrorhamnose reductase [candidate division TA06 bacterium]|uniref:dTDP-4-dehydrorhamnose reductase n=1 Tax=candidate division TA06 bacterium TaxID=2250710 RepID=A0A933MKP7_UNCT6|nr:dTDP-4-dehydrorhamnose reductase [candidate division TA06 bacterium]
MQILVTGAKGMLGTDLCAELSAQHQITGVDIGDFDLSQKKAVKAIADLNHQLVVHCAAMTDVDGCESDPDKAYLVNGLGTRHAALACQKLDIPMLYLSTDFVFDGAKREPYYEWDSPNPLGHYGRSKLAGEMEVRDLLKKFYIVRTSWLFGINGKNFVASILKKARETGSVKVVDDQTGSPTYTRDLCNALSMLIQSDLYGVYHLSNSGSCTWHQLAKKAVELAGIKAEVLPIKSHEYPTPTKRPAYSVLNNFAWTKDFKIPLRPWEEGLKDYIRETMHVQC